MLNQRELEQAERWARRVEVQCKASPHVPEKYYLLKAITAAVAFLVCVVVASVALAVVNVFG